jgi:hypothetical protein
MAGFRRSLSSFHYVCQHSVLLLAKKCRWIVSIFPSRVGQSVEREDDNRRTNALVYFLSFHEAPTLLVRCRLTVRVSGSRFHRSTGPCSRASSRRSLSRKSHLLPEIRWAFQVESGSTISPSCVCVVLYSLFPDLMMSQAVGARCCRPSTVFPFSLSRRRPTVVHRERLATVACCPTRRGCLLGYHLRCTGCLASFNA